MLPKTQLRLLCTELTEMACAAGDDAYICDHTIDGNVFIPVRCLPQLAVLVSAAGRGMCAVTS